MEFQDKCPNCGHPRSEGSLFCGNCGKPFEERGSSSGESDPGAEENNSSAPIDPVYPAERESSDEPEKKYVAWEDRENLGFFEALWQTWKESVFSPEGFYAKLPHRGGLGSPILYAIIFGWIGIAVSQIISFAFSNAWMSMLSQRLDYPGMMWGSSGVQLFGAFTYMILAPVIILAALFISSGIYHLIFMIFGWAQRDFEATFRALAYSYGPVIFMVVPFCGGMVGGIWQIVIAIIGLKYMQKTTGGKAALVYFLPILLCCCLFFIFVMIMAAMGMSLFDSMGGFDQGWNY